MRLITTRILPLARLSPSTVIAGPVPAIHLAHAWTTGTSPVVTIVGGSGQAFN